MATNTVIEVWTDSQTTEAKAAVPMPAIFSRRAVDVKPEELSAKLKAFLSGFESVLRECPPVIGGFSVDQIELNLAVNASGGIELIGKLSAGVQASIKLVLRKE